MLESSAVSKVPDNARLAGEEKPFYGLKIGPQERTGAEAPFLNRIQKTDL